MHIFQEQPYISLNNNIYVSQMYRLFQKRIKITMPSIYFYRANVALLENIWHIWIIFICSVCVLFHLYEATLYIQDVISNFSGRREFSLDFVLLLRNPNHSRIKDGEHGGGIGGGGLWGPRDWIYSLHQITKHDLLREEQKITRFLEDNGSASHK